MAALDRRREIAEPDTGTGAAPAAWIGPEGPYVLRGPFQRWPGVADAALAAVVFVATVIAVTVSELDDGEGVSATTIGARPVGSFVLLAIAAGALWWRRAHSVVVTFVVLTVMALWAVAGYGDGNDLPLMVATYGVGRYSADHRLSIATLAAAVVVSVAGTLVDASQRVDLLPAVLLTALPWYVGRRIRLRGDYVALLRERADRLEAEQQTRARQAVAEERSRIARELHDVVAHQVSMITVQAGAAKTIAREDLDAAIEAMGEVEDAGRQALGELRHLLGVLRLDNGDPNDPDDLGPQRGLADVPALVAELGRTGADVTVAIGEIPTRLTAATDLSAYRIVQESLTNVVKHAGPAPDVEISIGPDGQDLVIEITNSVADDNRPAAAEHGFPTSGFGIAGMRERALLLGGGLTSGLLASGRYRVVAHLPLEPEAT